MKTKSALARRRLPRLHTLIRWLRLADLNLTLVGFGLPVSSDQLMIHRRNAARRFW